MFECRTAYRKILEQPTTTLLRSMTTLESSAVDSGVAAHWSSIPSIYLSERAITRRVFQGSIKVLRDTLTRGARPAASGPAGTSSRFNPRAREGRDCQTMHQRTSKYDFYTVIARNNDPRHERSTVSRALMREYPIRQPPLVVRAAQFTPRCIKGPQDHRSGQHQSSRRAPSSSSPNCRDGGYHAPRQ